jgi:kynurenine formamidase
LIRAAKLRAQYNLNAVGSTAPSTDHGSNILGVHGALLNNNVPSHVGMPKFGGSRSSGDVEARQIPAMSAAKSGTVVRNSWK